MRISPDNSYLIPFNGYISSLYMERLTWLLSKISNSISNSNPNGGSIGSVSAQSSTHDNNLSSLYPFYLSPTFISFTARAHISLLTHFFLTHAFFFLTFCSLLSLAAVFPPHLHAWWLPATPVLGHQIQHSSGHLSGQHGPDAAWCWYRNARRGLQLRLSSHTRTLLWFQVGQLHDWSELEELLGPDAWPDKEQGEVNLGILNDHVNMAVMVSNRMRRWWKEPKEFMSQWHHPND